MATLRSIAVPVVLVVVAAVQIALAELGTLTPWKGGGFGMFASVDAIGNRFLSVTLTDNVGGKHKVAVKPLARPAPLTNDFMTQTLCFPTVGRLKAIGASVLAANLVVSTADPAVIPTSLAYSPYGPLLANLSRTASDLEIIGPVRGTSSFEEIWDVEVSVLRVRVDGATGRFMLQPLLLTNVRPTIKAIALQPR